MDKLGIQLLVTTNNEYYRRCELSEDSADVPKHGGVVKDRTDVFVICAFVWFHT